jgi:hypothetical protein
MVAAIEALASPVIRINAGMMSFVMEVLLEF